MLNLAPPLSQLFTWLCTSCVISIGVDALYAMAGVVHPLNWPNSSPHSMLCQWAIVLSDPERSIRIMVDEIDIEDDSSCFWNYVMVFDSSAVENAVPPLLGNGMCGTNPPSGDLVATGNVVNVLYMYQSRHPCNILSSLYL